MYSRYINILLNNLPKMASSSRRRPEHFSTKDIPSLTGKIALVTGATGGLGFETALAFATAGATVLVGGRDETKGKNAVEKIKTVSPNANVSFAMIDQASLASVKKFATEYNAKQQPLDILVNNAGVMGPPTRLETSDHFEIQFGTNNLSHFALTGLLLPSLRRSTSPRVVNVSSIAAKSAKPLNFDNLNWTESYDPWLAYKVSKLINLLFTLELQRRSDLGSWGVTAISAHPGVAKTDLIANGPGNDTWVGRLINFLSYFLAHSGERGALPQIYAAVSPDAEKNGYYGPNGWFEMKGDVTQVPIPELGKDAEVAEKLWEVCEELTDVHWPK
ncbi:short-chain dehydrogenase TIC 32, chloroplastic isoform X2 [Folsomia candida]|uniref:short-chain dehydrogenase TIC 32, chloroplastic isoform X2 n=1 Tax=Folsomia candida TaxID=158441 RepID=UPI000B901664|nr:short-chain dehydrogenase TIC 32, chloroplastic isoform X2 [Folsomia candida]